MSASAAVERPPGKLYWYRSLAKERKAWAEETIVASKVYLAAPEQYNDPFEFRCRLDFSAPRQRKIEFATKYLIQKDNLAPAEAARRAQRMADPGWMSEPEFEEVMGMRLGETLVTTWRRTTGVLSLSTHECHPLMWSHYADAHRGICLEFDTDAGAGDNLLAAALEVHYQREFPVIKFFNDDEVERVRALALTKSDVWKYENEWRCVMHSRARQKVAYPARVLTGVTLGASISPSDETDVRAWLQRRQPKIQLRRVSLAGNRYEFEMSVIGY